MKPTDHFIHCLVELKTLGKCVGEFSFHDEISFETILAIRSMLISIECTAGYAIKESKEMNNEQTA